MSFSLPPRPCQRLMTKTILNRQKKAEWFSPMGESAENYFGHLSFKFHVMTELNHQNWTLTYFVLASLHSSVSRGSPIFGGGDIRSKFTPSKRDRGEFSVSIPKG